MQVAEHPAPPVSLDDLEESVIHAGRLIERCDHATTGKFHRSDRQPETYAEKVVNDDLHQRLMMLEPEAGWLSEAELDAPYRMGRHWIWIVDPIDGTREFLAGIPEYTISAALVHNGAPLLGAVYNPATGEGGVANTVTGQFRVFGIVSDSAGGERSDKDVLVSRTEFESDKIRALISDSVPMRPVGSMAYRLLRVAMGLSPCTISLTNRCEWDICGGLALLIAARKKAIRLAGGEFAFNQKDTTIRGGILAGVETNVDAICDKLKSAQK
ncbi:MAG: 3'(2'),5'-bisphosphate nucleotidase CysQ [Planctomycetes bacterium]|nr:3'(2'),5'-bisphosphate nucleotidase CysQ [Planctomycetota bacterium]